MSNPVKRARKPQHVDMSSLLTECDSADLLEESDVTANLLLPSSSLSHHRQSLDIHSAVPVNDADDDNRVPISRALEGEYAIS